MADKPEKPSTGLIPPYGGYRELRSYQNAEIVYDATVACCDRFVNRRSRTRDQMIQAARRGKQNIAEGSTASGICLINQTNYLLDRQLRQLERQFVREGGFTERLYRTRIQARKNRG